MNFYNKFLSFFEKKDNTDKFEKYLEARDNYIILKKSIENKKKKNQITYRELDKNEKLLKELLRKKLYWEKRLVDISKGLFVGVGVDLKIVKELVPIYLEWKKLVNHYFVYGTSQVGKSRLLANHVRQMIMNNWNVIVVDPKGGEGQEILSWIIEFAGEAGRTEDLFYIAPVYAEYTDCFNPIYALGNEEIASMVQLLCKGGGDKDADFFADFSYKVILATLYSLEFLETVSDPDGSIVQNRVNNELINYYKLMELRGEQTAKYDKLNKIIMPDVTQRMNTKRVHQAHNASDYSMVVDRTLITFKELAHYSNFDNLQYLIQTMLDFAITEIENKKTLAKLKYLKSEAINLMRDLKTIKEDFFIKVSTSLTTLLSQLSSGKIGQLLCTIRINPLVNRLYRKDKGLICIIQPAPLKFQKVSEMVLKIILKMFESVFGLIGATGRGMSRKVGLIIDEAKTVMYAGIEELYNKAGGLGMTIGGYTQSRGDLRYKLGADLAEVVEDCVNTLFYLRTNSKEAREYMAGNFGTVRKHTYNYSSQSTVTDGRFMIETNDEELVTPNHLKELDVGNGYVIHAKEKYRVEFPFQAEPLGVIEMPRLKEEEMIEGLTNLEIIIENEMKKMEELNKDLKDNNNELFGEKSVS
jgi:conjugal transfer pilus assembly protein TraD